MGIFDGILLCSDLDDTLFDSSVSVSEENGKAIEYFKDEGGIFTFATGRAPHGAGMAAKYVKPNAPIVCYNGGGIYDFKTDRLLWNTSLDKAAFDVMDMVGERMPQVAFEICTAENVYYSRENRHTRYAREIQKYEDKQIEYRDVEEDIIKVVMMADEEYIPEVIRLVADSEFADKFTYVQSDKSYYEILPKGTTKGVGMIKLAQMLGIDPKMTVAIGDNDNDYDMICRAGAGVAVANAVRSLLEVADYITVDHDQSAVAAVVEGLKNGNIRFLK